MVQTKFLLAIENAGHQSVNSQRRNRGAPPFTSARKQNPSSFGSQWRRSERRGCYVCLRHACLAPPFDIEFVDFAQNLRNVVLQFPIRVVLLEVREIADPPDVIATAIFVDVARVERLAGDLFAELMASSIEQLL